MITKGIVPRFVEFLATSGQAATHPGSVITDRQFYAMRRYSAGRI
jgi:hypothetical protein